MICLVMVYLLCGLAVMCTPGLAQDEVVLGVATGLTSLEGRESLRAANLAVEELNARGGIHMGGRSYGIKLVSIDLADNQAPLHVADVLARLGGDEFGILLDVLAGVMIMAVILQNIKQAFDDVDTARLRTLKE